MLTGIFWNNKIGHRAGDLGTEEMRLARLLIEGEKDIGGFDSKQSEIVARLVSKGYLKKKDGKVSLHVVAFLNGEYDALLKVLEGTPDRLSEDMADLFEGLNQQLEKMVPPHLSSQITQRVEALCINAMWFVLEEMKDQDNVKSPVKLDTSTEGVHLKFDR